MKLALVVPGGVDRSGEYRVIPALLNLIERLARTHQVHVYALRQEIDPADWELRGAMIHNIGNAWPIARAIAAIISEHRRGRFHCVQAIFSSDVGLVAALTARVLRIPSLVHVAGGELVAMPDIAYGNRRTWKGRFLEALVLRLANRVSAPSAPILASLRKLGINAVRVPLGVDLTEWMPIAPRRRHSPVMRLIHVASLNLVKDQATLLRALARLAERGVAFHMDVIGVDTLDGAVQAMATRLGLNPYVRFLGYRTQRELRPMMVAADLHVLSSYHEAGPLVLLEAAVVGVPTVGTSVGHLAEWAPDAACVVAPGDAEGLAKAMMNLASDEDLRLRLAWTAQRRAMCEDADYTARAFEAHHLSLVKSTSSRLSGASLAGALKHLRRY